VENGEKALRQVLEKDPRFPVDAYRFLFEALRFTVDQLPAQRHVSGRELLEGVRQYALQQFGGMARTVLRHWNIRRTEDIGDMVFNLVEANLMGKTDTDSKNDFKGGYDFDQAFPVDYTPGRN
jgi:uncharacterized repeat protein (TIGR04138 family)